jgi:hypothetical protein
MEDHVNWPTQMGARVLINDGWFSTFGCCVKIFVRVSLSNPVEA